MGSYSNLFFVGVAAVFTASLAISCIRRDEELVLREDGRDASPGPFYCLRMKSQTDSTIVAKPIHMKDGEQLCAVTNDKTLKTKQVLAKSAVSTGHYCKYKCVENENAYRCKYPPREDERECGCEKAGPRATLVSVVGVGPDALDETCDGKAEGYQFPDPVACTSIQAEVTKERVRFIPGSTTMCKVEKGRRTETRYTKTLRVERNLQGCMYVCRKPSPKCKSAAANGECGCASGPAVKVLVPLSQTGVSHMLDQVRCGASTDCGPCAACDAGTGECRLHERADEGNYCGCGEICPWADRRARENRGGKVMCVPNVKKHCMRTPEWMGGLLDGSVPGTKRPDLCTQGATDDADVCSCAPGYSEVPGPYSSVYCRKGATATATATPTLVATATATAG